MIREAGSENACGVDQLAFCFLAPDLPQSTWRSFCKREPPECSLVHGCGAGGRRAGGFWDEPSTIYFESYINTAHLRSPHMNTWHFILALSMHQNIFHVLRLAAWVFFKREILLFGKISFSFCFFFVVVGCFYSECIVYLCDLSEGIECLGTMGRYIMFRACFYLSLWHDWS